MSAETRDKCQRMWDLHQAEQEKYQADRARFEEITPIMHELHTRFGIPIKDEHFHLWPECPPPDSRVAINLAFALKAHLLDEGTGWSPER